MTLTTIEHLEQLNQSAQSRLEQMAAEIRSAEEQAELLQTKAGSALTREPKGWTPGERMPRVEAAKGLETLVETLAQSLAEITARPHHGIGGLIGNVRDKHEAVQVESQLQSAKAELDRRYRSVADQVTVPTGLSQADGFLTQTQDRLARAHELKVTSEALSSELQHRKEEVQKRQEASQRLGFDALGVEANLIANGPTPISTDLVLKRGEIAVASASATLCRHKTRTQFVGGSQGLSIPLGHGFRYRVSSFRGHPIQSDVLAQLDQGNLVVTNQRLVFLGSKRDVSTPIAKLIQIEPFSNGVGISREGKESRDIYLLERPAYIVLFLQWSVAHQG